MDIAAIRRDFPFFDQPGAPVYLDHAATAQKPGVVIDRLTQFYRTENANIHRGGYSLAQAATRQYEHARQTVATFIGAQSSEIAFTMNATDSLNQAISMVFARFGPGKNAVTTLIEHHSALLPLQRACQQTGTELRLLPLLEDGTPDVAVLNRLVDDHTVCAVLTMGANSTGWKLPWEQVLPKLTAQNVTVILDASQRIAHDRLDVRALGCDFLCFSGHKLYGPTGIGVLYMKETWAQSGLVRLGGGMVEEVTGEGFRRVPDAAGLEAGTPPIAQALALEAAINYLNALDLHEMYAHEHSLLRAMRDGLSAIPGIRLIGAAQQDGLPIAAFVSDALHALDLCRLLDIRGFALREGRHCAHLYHEHMGLSATIRASCGLYTTLDEIFAMLNAVEAIQTKWRRSK